jgi:hypothetical protein
VRRSTYWLCGALALLASPGWARGGQTGDNGGDAVVCRSAQGDVQEIDLLDYYEAKALYGLELDVDANRPYAEQLETLLGRLDVRDHARVERYRQYQRGFVGRLLFMDGVVLQDVPDSRHVLYPRGCGVEQLAIQKPAVLPGDPLLLINQDLWRHLNEGQKAGLLLHEIVYADAIQRSTRQQALSLFEPATARPGCEGSSHT